MNLKSNVLKLIVLLIGFNALWLTNEVKAQNNSGTEFWFTLFAEDYLDHLPGVYIVSYYDCQVTIDYVARDPANDFAGDPQCTQNVVNVTGGVPLYVDIPYDGQALCWRYADTLAQPEVVRYNGIRVTSTAPIALYSQFFAAASSEMTPILPIEEMGQNYIVNAYREITSETNNFNARTTVVGIEDNTNVTFTLPDYCWTSTTDADGAMSHGPGDTWSITLNRGQTYTILSNDNGQTLATTPTGSTVTVDNNQGLNGMHINADKNISVLGGTDCTWIGNDEYSGCGACDMTCEHLKPSENWGTRFVSTQTLQRNTRSTTALRNPPPPNIEPLPTASIDRSVSDYLLITAKDDNTTVNITGDFNYTKTLNSGEWFIYESPGNANLAAPPSVSPGRTNHVIDATGPIEVTQMMKGWQCDNNNPADPTQMMVREEDTWEDNYIVTNPTQYANNFFVFIIEEPFGGSEARNSLTISVNGTDINIPTVASPTFDGTAGWTQMGTTPYYYQRVNVAAGGAIRAKSAPLTPGGATYKFGFYASGSTNASSYGYMGGNVCQLEAFAHADTANICLGDPVTFVLDSTRNGGTVASIINYDYQWTYLAGNDTVYEFTGQGADPTHSYMPTTPPDSAGVYTGYLYITDNAGCDAVDTFTVVIEENMPNPTVGPDVVICEGADINLAANSTVDTVTYDWFGPLGFTSNDQNPVINNATTNMAGTYSVSVSKNGCVSDTLDVEVTVNSNDTITLTSASGTENQTVCENIAIDNITYTMSGGATSVASSGLPAGVSGSFAGGIYTITGTPTDTGLFNYMVFTTGICEPDTLQGSIQVNPDATINLTSAAGTDAQDICFSDAITDITYDVAGGGTDATASGLPAGLTGSFASGVFTISGTPTEVGSFNYTVNTTGTCVQTSAAGTINIGQNDTITMTSAAGTDNQTICFNESLANITYDVTGGATDAVATGLPTGVSGVYAGGVFTISGTPTQTGTFNYVVNTVGTCVKDSAVGTLVINELPIIDSIPTTDETSCGADDGTITIHATGSGLTYSIDGGANYGGSNSFTGLMAGSYNVMVMNSDNCVVDGGVVSISSAGAPPEPTANVNSNALCEGDTLILTVATPVGGETYDWTGPNAYAASGDSVAIVGVDPSMAGTYTVTASIGACVSPGNSVAVAIDSNAVIALSSAAGTDGQSLCVNNPIDNITYNISGGGTGATVSGLPTGVSGVFAGGVYTISGTPTQTGTFNYTVNTTGNCAQTSAAGTITINEDATILLTSAAGSDAQTLCENTAITDITYDVAGGGTGATVSGLPNGVTGSFAGGVYTISGTPTETGTFNFTVNTTGNCAQTSVAGTITVEEDAAIALSSAAGSDTQTVCVNNTITTITYNVSGGGTGANVSGLPTGLTGSFAGGVFTISGTPTQTGTFNYTVNTTGNCAQTSAVGSITVNEDAAIALTSAAGSDAQSVCINNAITDVTYSVSGGGTDATVSGLPTGLSGSFAGGVFTISGTPTQTGTFNYTVNTTGNCAQTSAVGSITVNEDATIALSSAAGTDAQTICVNTAMNNIEYTIAGGGTDATATGLPNGVTGSFAGGVFTISGTPTETGTFNYTVNTTGSCAQTSAAGSITIEEDAAIALSSAAGTDAQSICVNNGITDIQYSVTGGGTDATVTGLPNGVTGSFAGGVFTISGTPTETGTFNYTVNTTGSCAQTSAVGTITVNEDAAIALTSTLGTDAQSICENNAITDITYDVTGGGTGATATGLPNGVTGSFAGGVFTISGTPTESGTFNYTVNTTGNCAQTTASGSITINDCTIPTASFTATSLNICIGDTVTFTDNSTGININNWDWTIDGGVPGTANTQGPHEVVFSTAGSFNITLEITDDNGTDDTTVTLVVNDLPTVVANASATDICDGDSVTLTGSGAQNYAWDNGVTDGVAFTPISTGTYTVIGTDANGCENSNAITVNVNPCNIPVASFDASSTVICAGDDITFTDNSTGGITGWDWTFAGGSPATANTQGNHVVNFANPGTYNITLEVTNANGTDDTTMVVTVNDCSVPTASFTASATNICVGESIDFTDNSSGMNINAWSWDFDGASPASANTQGPHNVTFTAAGTYDVMLTITDDNGTDDSVMTITVNDLPTVVGNATSTVICSGESVTLTGAGAQSYTWDNGVVDGVAFNPTATNTYTVTGTDINGCVNTKDVTVTVNVCTTLTASFTASSTNICEGESITFTDNSTGGVTGWDWTFNGGTPSTANTQGAHTVTFNAAGTYNIDLEVSNANGTDDTTIVVTVNSAPMVTFISTEDNCEESTGTITGIVISGAQPLTYNWDNGATDSLLTGLEAGTYNVLLTDANGCTASNDVVVDMTAVDCKYFVYVPNVFSPNNDGNNDVFYVRGKGIRTMNIKIFNRWGNKVYESGDIEEGWDGTYNGNVQNTAVFVYVLDALLENGDRVTESGNVSIIK